MKGFMKGFRVIHMEALPRGDIFDGKSDRYRTGTDVARRGRNDALARCGATQCLDGRCAARAQYSVDTDAVMYARSAVWRRIASASHPHRVVISTAPHPVIARTASHPRRVAPNRVRTAP